MSVHGAFFLLLAFLSLRRALVYAEPAEKDGFDPFLERVFTGTASSITRNDNVSNAVSITPTFLGGEALGKPCCVSWEPGRVDCFIRGLRSNVLHRAIRTSDSIFDSTWTNIDGFALGEIECISRGRNFIDLIVVNKNNQLYTNSFARGGWIGWSERPNVFAGEAPGCVARVPNIIDCLYRNANNQNWLVTQVNGNWGAPEPMGGIAASPIACSSRNDGIIDCFAAGTQNGLWVKTWAGRWLDWAPFGGSVTGRPSVTWVESRINVFVLGTENNVWVKTWAGQWLDWVNLGGPVNSEPECVTFGPDKIHCFAIGRESWLYRNSLADGGWSGWIAELTGLVFLETPSCVVSGQDQVACYVRDPTMGITQIIYQF